MAEVSRMHAIAGANTRAPLEVDAVVKDGRGLRQFARRGLDAVQAELALAAAVTNLLKISTNGVTAAQLRTG